MPQDSKPAVSLRWYDPDQVLRDCCYTTISAGYTDAPNSFDKRNNNTKIQTVKHICGCLSKRWVLHTPAQGECEWQGGGKALKQIFVRDRLRMLQRMFTDHPDCPRFSVVRQGWARLSARNKSCTGFYPLHS